MRINDSFNRMTHVTPGEAVVLGPVCGTFVGIMAMTLGLFGFVLAVILLLIAESKTRPTDAEMDTP